MNSITSGIGSGIGFGLGHRLFGASTTTAATSEQQQASLQPSTPVDACSEMKMRLFAMKEAPIRYHDDGERYYRLFEEYQKLCVQH